MVVILYMVEAKNGVRSRVGGGVVMKRWYKSTNIISLLLSTASWTPSPVTTTTTTTNGAVVEEWVCFNTILEIVCGPDEVIVFENARYGRNDSAVALRCDVPYTRNCDIDVHFSLNRACAGKQRCSMAVNTAFFGDPCGYEEFLKVTYRCVTGECTRRRRYCLFVVTLAGYGERMSSPIWTSATPRRVPGVEAWQICRGTSVLTVPVDCKGS